MLTGFTNGCFDIIHVGHLRLISSLTERVDHLVVGIDSDRMVRSSKGNDRPYNNQEDRKFFLENIKGVAEVFIFDSHDELRSRLENLNPDHMVVGSDYRHKEVIGSEHAKTLSFFEVIDGYSSTEILQYTSSG